MTPRDRDLEGKLFVVTGGSSGIGAATVLALARPARVVDVVSDLHARVAAADLDREPPYHFLRSYAIAELRKVLVSRELARRLARRGVDVNCVHPGGVRTRLFRDVGGPL